MRLLQNILIFTILIYGLFSCKTVRAVYKNDNFLPDGESVKITVFENKGQVRTAEIKSSLLPSVTFKGTADESEDGVIINIDRMYTITNGFRSYSEAEFIVFGQIRIVNNYNSRSVQVLYKPEIIDIAKGEMRIRDNYFRGSDGAGRMNNKLERLDELQRFLKERPEYGNYERSQRGYNYYFSPKRDKHEDFYSKTRRLLFPELYGFRNLDKAGLLAEEYDIEFINRENDYIIADDVAYRKSYTEVVIPESLSDVRNTGTMLNDFNESRMLLKALFNSDYFFDEFLGGQEIVKIEKK